MTVLSINFWILYVICLVAGIWLILWSLRLKKKNKDNTLIAAGLGLSFASTASIGTILLLSRFFPFESPSTPSVVFLMWIFYLLIAFVSLMIKRHKFRENFGDRPDKANESLKKLQKKQQQQVRQLMAK